jgi:hypothetical protein
MTHVLVITEALPVETPAQRKHFSLMAIVGIAGGFGRICPSCADQVAERLLADRREPEIDYWPCWVGCDLRHVAEVEAYLRARPALVRC